MVANLALRPHYFHGRDEECRYCGESWSMNSKYEECTRGEDVVQPVIKKPIDAVLHNAVLHNNILIGNIEADCKQRFKDGDLVTTSKLVAQYGNVFYTSNSVYYVADWNK